MNKANDMINKFSFAGDKFMSELHLVDPIVKKYSACGLGTLLSTKKEFKILCKVVD